jgi:hypothetical protein
MLICPVYDKYEDDRDVEDFLFQQYSEEQSIRSTEENSLPLCFATFKLLKENSQIIVEANEFVLMQSHTKPTKQIDKILEHSSQTLDDPILCFEEDLVNSEIQSLVEDKAESEHVQKSKEMEKCTYDDTGKNEEGFESGNRTLPLCFPSFELLKQNVCSVSNQKTSKHGIESEESSGLTDKNSLPLCFSSFEWLRENHEISEKIGSSDYIHSSIVLHEKVVIIEEHQLHSHALNDHYLEGYFNSKFQSVLNHQIKEEVDQGIFVEGLFLSPRTNADVQQYYQQDKVFQGCLSSPENDVVILFLNNLDMDEDFEISPMETPNNEETLVEEAFSSILIPEKESFFHMIHDPKTHYVEKVYNQNLPIIVDYNESMFVPDMNLFTPDDVLQPWLPYDSEIPTTRLLNNSVSFLEVNKLNHLKTKMQWKE